MFIYVGTMDGYTDRGYSSFEDMGTSPSASEDDLDIVGEAISFLKSNCLYLHLPCRTLPLRSVQGFRELHG
jgi:hypothetical protein